MTGLLTFRVSPENRATAQPRNRATAQPRNRAIVRGILSHNSASFRRCQIFRDDYPNSSVAAPILKTAPFSKAVAQNLIENLKQKYFESRHLVSNKKL